MASTTVTFEGTASMYVLRVDGEEAGFAQVRLDEGRVLFTHTEVFEAFKGGGYAAVLAREALADAVSRGWRIVPLCPYIARYLRRNEVPGAVIEWPGE